MMLAFALLLSLAGVIASDSTQAEIQPPDCVGGHVFTRADLDAAGVVYLSDLYRLLDGVRATTLDGFTWQPTHSGGVPFDGDAFTVLVDGGVHTLGLFGEQDLELLPVPVHEIARVTFCPTSGLAEGRWASSGTLHIETLRADHRVGLRAALQFGNETGDPGPLQHTDRATPNVDRIGPDGEGALFYGSDSVALRATGRFYRTFPTDPAQFARTRLSTTRNYPNQWLLTGGLDAITEAFGGVHTATVSARINADFRFTEAAGRELPTERADARVGVRGAWLLGPTRFGPLFLHHRLVLDAQTLSADDSALPEFAPRWRRTMGTASLEARLGTASHQFRAGATLDRTLASGAGLPEGTGFTHVLLYLQRIRAPREGLRQHTDLALSASGEHARLKAAQTLEQRLGPQTLSLTLGLDGRLPEEEGRLPYWSARGFTGVERDAVRVQATGLPQPSTEVSARANWRANLGMHAHAQLSIEGRQLRGLTIERPVFSLPLDEAAVEGTVMSVPDARGETVGVHAVTEAWRGAWKGRVFYSLLTDVGGSEAFREAWSRVPTHRAGAALTLRPDAGFVLQTMLTVESGTRWLGYAALDGAIAPNGAVFSDGTPTRWLLDATASRLFWERRIRVSLAFRNLLNAKERYHPLGATLDLRLFVRATAQLYRPPAAHRPDGDAN